MRALATAVIVVGDEILAGHTLDTNSNHLAQAARQAGRPVVRIEVVGDAIPAISAAVAAAAADPTLSRIVVCGGIGPTPDDMTLEGVAAGLARDLEENGDALAAITARVLMLHEAGRLPTPEVSPANRRMAMAPAGAQALANPQGMAPPLALTLDGDDRLLFVLPGVPREFTAIVDEVLIPRFFGGGAPETEAEVIYSGVPEAEMAAPMIALGSEYPDLHIGSYPQAGRREVVIRIGGADAARVETAAARLRQLRPPS